jgi:hypothetical protein
MRSVATTISSQKILYYILAALLGALLAFAPEIAQAGLPLPDNSDLDVAAPEGDTAVEKFGNILGPIARILRIIIGSVAVLLIVISGFVMVVKGDSEDSIKKEKDAIKYGIIGLMMISIAGPIAEVFDFQQGNYLTDAESFVERASLFGNTTQMVITFIKYFLGSLAALMFVRSGALLVAGGANEDTVSKEKKSLGVAAAGLLMVILSDLVVKKVFFVAQYSEDAEATIVAIDQSEFIKQVVGATNLMVSFVGPIMMLGLIVGGFLYVTAGGDEEKTGLAKKIILNSIIGVVIIYGAFALVSTLVSGQF